MKNKVLKVWLGALLVVGGMLSVSQARADFNDNPYDSYDCIGNVCVGDTVSVVAGEWVGHAGTVVGVDDYNNTVTVLNSSGYYLYPHISHVRLINQGGSRYCSAEFCVGDRITIVSGIYRGESGRIIGTDDRYYEVTILSDRGQYITVSISDIYLLQRGTQPYPGPRPVPVPRPRPGPICPPGTYWDAYLQRCIAPRPVPRPMPRPVPYPGPRPAPYPRPYPGPGPRPVPYPGPRPVPGPGPRPVPGPRPMPPHPVPMPGPHR